MIKKNFSLDDETTELYEKVLQQKKDCYCEKARLNILLNICAKNRFFFDRIM